MTISQVCRTWHAFVIRPVNFSRCVQFTLNDRCVAMQQACNAAVEARYNSKVEFTQDYNYYELSSPKRKDTWESERQQLLLDKSIETAKNPNIIELARKRYEEYATALALRLISHEYREDAPNNDVSSWYPNVPSIIRDQMHVLSQKTKSVTTIS